MITTWEEYQKNYVDLLVNNVMPAGAEKMVNPETEPKFIINADTRIINIPKAFENGVAVYKDYKSETLFFEIDRFFDTADFSTKKCCVQFINSENQSSALPITWKYVSEDLKKLIVGWTLPHEVTVKEGEVTFSIRFFSTDEKDNVINFNWSTRPATIKIYKGLYITEGSETIPSKSTLEELIDRIENVWGNDGKQIDYANVINVPTISGREVRGEVSEMILDLVFGNTEGKVKYLTINDILQSLQAPGGEKGMYPVSNDALQMKFDNIDTGLGDLEEKIKLIEEEMEDMTFIPITINSFEIQPVNVANYTKGNTSLVEQGTRVGTMEFFWSLSKSPTTLKINNTPVTSLNMNGSSQLSFTNNPITTNRTFTLEAAEKKGDPSIAEANLVFCDNVYWGVSNLKDIDTINQDFIKGLNEKRLIAERGFEISVNISNNQYLYIAIPTSLGNNFSFFFDGSALSGGMSLINENQNIAVTGINNHVAYYQVYRSTNSGLGQRTIKIE